MSSSNINVSQEGSGFPRIAAESKSACAHRCGIYLDMAASVNNMWCMIKWANPAPNSVLKECQVLCQALHSCVLATKDLHDHACPCDNDPLFTEAHSFKYSHRCSRIQQDLHKPNEVKASDNPGTWQYSCCTCPTPVLWAHCQAMAS